MPTPRTEVRTARAQEYEAIGELSASTYLAEGYADQSYAHVLRDVAGRAASATVLVALRDDRLIGSIAVAVAGGPFAEQAGPGEAVIRMLVTDPAARGTGAGTALVAAALERAREAGCGLVRLSTQASMTAAHHVYEKAGFTRTPQRDWSPVPGVDLLTYELPLNDGWCRLCGRPGRHQACERALGLEPPRYCAACRRRLVVQVLPTGWTARCSEHGVSAG